MILLKLISLKNSSRSLKRTGSGGSVESGTTPLKVLQKDDSMGEYIVKMSPQDFDQLAQG